MSFFKDKLTHKVEEFIRANGIVFWLDTDSRFSSFIDLLETDFTNKVFNYPIYRFNGSFLEVMLALRNSLEGKSGKPSLLCYVPKITSEQIKKTPLLEVFKFSYHITETLPEGGSITSIRDLGVLPAAANTLKNIFDHHDLIDSGDGNEQ